MRCCRDRHAHRSTYSQSVAQTDRQTDERTNTHLAELRRLHKLASVAGAGSIAGRPLTSYVRPRSLPPCAPACRVAFVPIHLAELIPPIALHICAQRGQSLCRLSVTLVHLPARTDEFRCHLAYKNGGSDDTMCQLEVSGKGKASYFHCYIASKIRKKKIYFSLRCVRSNETELNWHDLVFDEMTNGRAVMHCSKHRLTRWLTWLCSRTRQPMLCSMTNDQCSPCLPRPPLLLIFVFVLCDGNHTSASTRDTRAAPFAVRRRPALPGSLVLNPPGRHASLIWSIARRRRQMVPNRRCSSQWSPVPVYTTGALPSRLEMLLLPRQIGININNTKNGRTH